MEPRPFSSELAWLISFRDYDKAKHIKKKTKQQPTNQPKQQPTNQPKPQKAKNT